MEPQVPSVSLLVTVYNKELYVGQCLDSLLSQTHESLEIIVLDDGSSDRSVEMASVCASRDSRVRVVAQENQGHGPARNAALANAVGDYVMYVDADDYLLRPDAVALMVEKAVTDDCEVVLSAFGGKDAKWTPRTTTAGVDVLRWLIASGLYHASMCARLFKRSFLFDNDLDHFSSLIVNDEDWTPRVLVRAARVGLVPIEIYGRRVLPTSVSGLQSEANYCTKALDRITASRTLFEFYDAQGLDDPILGTHAVSLYVASFGILAHHLRTRVCRAKVVEAISASDDLERRLAQSDNLHHRVMHAAMRVLGLRAGTYAILVAMRVRDALTRRPLGSQPEGS